MSLFPRRAQDGLPLFPAYGQYNRVYCVDSVNGSATADGLGWGRALNTIQAAVNKARYLPGTTTIDDTKDHSALVLVAPGHYNVAAGAGTLFSGYNIEIRGVGPAVPGKDYGVSINYDGAVTTTAVLGFSGSGITLRNLHIYCDAAIPALYIAGGDNNLIENCVIECDGTNCTYGIQADSMKGSWIRDVVIRTPVTAGIYVAGGANHYAIDGGIQRAKIYAAAAGAKGIYVENTNTVYNFEISDCKIDVEAAGATAKGIDNDATGNMIISENKVVIETAATAIESASHGVLHNYVSTNGTVTDPFDDD